MEVTMTFQVPYNDVEMMLLAWRIIVKWAEYPEDSDEYKQDRFFNLWHYISDVLSDWDMKPDERTRAVLEERLKNWK